MIGPYERYAELEVTDRFALSKTQMAMVPQQSTLDEIARAALKTHELELQPAQLYGEHFVMLEGARGGGCWQLRLHRSFMYSCAEFDEVAENVETHVAAIAEEHGPGRVWFLYDPVHYIGDIDDRVLGAFVRDYPAPMLLMRTFYAHEKQAQLEFVPARDMAERVTSDSGSGTPRG